MDNIQEIPLRFVYDDSITSYEELLNKSNLSTLHIRRTRTMAIEAFKILHGLCPPVLTNPVQKGKVHIILSILIFCRFRRYAPVRLARAILDIRHRSTELTP